MESGKEFPELPELEIQEIQEMAAVVVSMSVEVAVSTSQLGSLLPSQESWRVRGCPR
jgi:hypothetical protein